MENILVAVLYQVVRPPAVSGFQKPMKETGYADSSADIAFHLRSLGRSVTVLLPVELPDPLRDTDWCWADDAATLEHVASLAKAPSRLVLFCNVMMYSTHPAVLLARSHSNVTLVCQDTACLDHLENKKTVHDRLSGVPGALLPPPHALVPLDASTSPIGYPCIVKPPRGRGSFGVQRVNNDDEFRAAVLAIRDGGMGDGALIEKYLSGREFTFSCFPFASKARFCAVQRMGHEDGVMPYSLKTPVAANSIVIETGLEDAERAAQLCVSALGARTLARVDAREDENGKMVLIEVNWKPNMTAPGRHPGREAHRSLTYMALREETFGEMLLEMIHHALTL